MRVIALTAHDDRAHLTRLLQPGAAGYVLKRSAPDELVRYALEQGWLSGS